MAFPTSGEIDFADINSESGSAPGTQVSLGHAGVTFESNTFGTQFSIDELYDPPCFSQTLGFSAIDAAGACTDHGISPSTYYTDNAAYAIANTLSSNSDCSTPAGDGWYSDGSVSRECSSGALISSTGC